MDVRPAPDSDRAAVVVTRPSAPGEYFERSLSWRSRSDIFLIDANGRVSNLTDGQRDNTGAWNPIWSPDGKSLAYLTTRGGRSVQLFVKRADGIPTRVTSSAVDIDCAFRLDKANQRGTVQSAFAWIDSNHIIANLLRAAPSGYDQRLRTDIVESTGLQAAMRGTASTARIIVSPAAGSLQRQHPEGVLTIVSLPQHGVVELARLPIVNAYARSRVVLVSPNGSKFAAFWVDEPIQIGQGRGVSHDEMTPFEYLLGSIPNLDRLVSAPSNFAWRPSSLWKPTSRLLLSPGIAAVWSSDSSNLLFLAGRRGLRSLPNLVLAIANTTKRRVQTVPSPSHQRLSSANDIVWCNHKVHLHYPVVPNGTAVDDSPNINREQAGSWYGFDEASHPNTFGIATEERSPSCIATRSEDASSWSADSNRVIRVKKGEDVRVIWNPNAKIDAEVVSPKIRVLHYRGLGGRQLDADLVLPFRFRPGRTYPTIVFQYPGQIIHGRAGPEMYFFSFLNAAILAGRGYAVLLPSMPLQPYGSASEPFSEIATDLNAALQAAFRTGIVDHKKLGLLGESYGGYGVDAAIAQTGVFRAAVSMNAVPVDMAMTYGIFDHRYRYDNPLYASAAGAFYLENYQGRMGAALPLDRQHYARNNPLDFAYRIRTPLLLIRGSQDLQLGSDSDEALFTQLYRLNRKVELVTYVGEEHDIVSPPNVLDAWRRILDWYNRYLKP